MAAIDLTHIIYRAHEPGDVDTSKNVPNDNGGTSGVSLAGIKFRSKLLGDVEED
jgi:hypothetical protein